MRNDRSTAGPGPSEKPAEEEKSDLVALGCVWASVFPALPGRWTALSSRLGSRGGAIVVAAARSVLCAGSHPDSAPAWLQRTVEHL